jgi:4-oxalomesaconate tautomerase
MPTNRPLANAPSAIPRLSPRLRRDRRVVVRGAAAHRPHTVDTVAGLDVTLVDNGMPVVVLRAADLGVSGQEACADLEAHAGLRDTLERVRLAAGPLMGLGDVATATVPKSTLVAPPRAGGALAARTFTPTAVTTPSAC